MSSSSKDDLKKLTDLVRWYEGSLRETPASPVSGYVLDKITDSLGTIAHAALDEYLKVGLPSKLIIGTSLRVVPIDDLRALAEGREGIVSLVGEGMIVHPTLALSFRTIVYEDREENPEMPKTLHLAKQLTELRGRANRQRLLQLQQET